MFGDLDATAFVLVSDSARARAFYVDTLGLALIDDSPFAVVVRSGTTVIRVTPVSDHTPVAATVLGWSVPDIDAAIAELARRGVSVAHYDGMGQDERGVWTAPGGAQIAWFADPDGNTLSVTQHQ